MKYPKELWNIKNEQRYGHGGDDIDEEIVRYCADYVQECLPEYMYKQLLREFGLKRKRIKA